MDRTTVLQRVSTASVSLVLAVFGFTGFAAANAALSTQGPNSGISAFSSDKELCKVTNTNNINVSNNNTQHAHTGDVKAFNNTHVGNWQGWLLLNPKAYQDNGISFASWHDDVMLWVSERHSGSGWNSSNDNLTWKPASNAWHNWDPVLWQTHGQSFENWSAKAMSHLHGNLDTWKAGWPAHATGTSNGLGVGSGNASNNSSFNLNISVNNAPSSNAALEACLPGVAAKPVKPGGKGGQEVKKPGKQVLGAAVSAKKGKGVGVGGVGAGHVAAAAHKAAPAAKHVVTPGAVSKPKAPVAPKPAPKKPAPTITTKGPDSPIKSVSVTTAKTTVSNTNNINVSNNTTQKATSGGVTTVNNTSVGGSSGGANNDSSGNVSAKLDS